MANRITEAARALAAKLREIHDDPEFISVWTIAHLHRGPYSGPTYVKELEALEAALSHEPGQQDWQPIETAPREEGVSVLLGWALEGNWPPCIGFWSGDYHGAHAWCDDGTENDFTPQPTHWQPLPAAPAARALLHNGGKE